MNEINTVKSGNRQRTRSGYLDKITTDLLVGDDYTVRHNARIALVKLGRKAVLYLNGLLSSKNVFQRREIAKVIQLIADRRSVPIFISLLDDPDFEIRWIAGQGLISIGRKSIKPLLKSLSGGKSSLFIGNGAHHVLNTLLSEDEKRQMRTLLLSLDNYHETIETAPVEALKAMKMFRFND